MSKRHFFPILGTLKMEREGGIILLETLMSDPDSVQKGLPSRVKDFWCFSGSGVGGLAVWGATHLRALITLGRSYGKPLVWSRWSRIYLSIYLFIYLFINLSICPSIYLSASLNAKLFGEICSILKFSNVKKIAIQRNFLNFYN